MEIHLNQFIKLIFKTLNEKDMVAILQNLSTSQLNCPDVLALINKWIVINYSSINVNILINLVQKLILCCEILPNEIYNYLNHQIIFNIDKINTISTPVKFITIFLLSDKMNLINHNVIKRLFEKMSRMLTHHYLEQEKK